ncbi:hypothetical protein MRX96_049145 [Rhipicephalus microplus]
MAESADRKFRREINRRVNASFQLIDSEADVINDTRYVDRDSRNAERESDLPSEACAVDLEDGHRRLCVHDRERPSAHSSIVPETDVPQGHVLISGDACYPSGCSVSVPHDHTDFERRAFHDSSAAASTSATSQNEPRDTSSDDKFWKVRPLLDVIRSRCLQLEELEQNCIDEQMVAFSGRVPAKQVVKSNPNPVGVKIFVRCSTDGLAHDFELYKGKDTGIDREFSYLGLGECVVMRLVESLPQHRNLKLFFDNYFTSVLLLRELKSIEILATGTIRFNRLMGCQLKGEKCESTSVGAPTSR